ncbi:LPS export ABC transporter permease LptG [Sutterella sp.]|uniref:LPS export ABC transporter permease LptG n=1 Tax=Sutterella sp. TaxID=1981025 RepID=UPI0026DFCDCE|nr:LPS export ABC transporter permease LptG [Sutterella sp.]MDO5532697.1 LPS export ABC transporter permease LptG [Sutterella sp.]
MSVIARQFTKEILLSTLFVLVILIALFAFFDLIGQMDEVAGNRYDLATAFLLTGLTLPSRAYEVSPLAVLLAAVYTMSRWASTSEFTVLRAAGLSPQRLAVWFIIPGILLMALTYALGEGVAPWAQRYGQEIRAAGTTLSARGYSSGAWVRDVTKAENGATVDRYINIRSISASDRNRTGAWRIFEFNGTGRLERLIRAESAQFTAEKGWVLRNVTTVYYPELTSAHTDERQSPVESELREEVQIPSTITPEILGVMTTKPDRMGMVDLSQYIQHLEKVNQEADHFVSVFWQKAFYPLAVLVMLAISMPFGYMNARSGGVAIKIFTGVLIGIAFYALNNLFSYLSIFSSAPPWLMAVAPSILMLIASAGALVWVERR